MTTPLPPSSSPANEYPLCVGTEDQERLAILNEIYNPSSQEFIKPALNRALRVMEVGCGHGQMAKWIAANIGKNDGSVLALDADPLQISQCLKMSTDHINHPYN